jgi:hypothetical protein
LQLSDTTLELYSAFYSNVVPDEKKLPKPLPETRPKGSSSNRASPALEKARAAMAEEKDKDKDVKDKDKDENEQADPGKVIYCAPPCSN